MTLSYTSGVAIACEGGGEEAKTIEWIAPNGFFKTLGEERVATIENVSKTKEYTVTSIALESPVGGPYFSIPNFEGEREVCERKYKTKGNPGSKCSFKIKYSKVKGEGNELAYENIIMKVAGLPDKPLLLGGEP